MIMYPAPFPEQDTYINVGVLLVYGPVIEFTMVMVVVAVEGAVVCHGGNVCGERDKEHIVVHQNGDLLEVLIAFGNIIRQIRLCYQIHDLGIQLGVAVADVRQVESSVFKDPGIGNDGGVERRLGIPEEALLLIGHHCAAA